MAHLDRLHRRGPGRTTSLLAVVLAVGAILVACDADGEQDARLDGLLVMSGDVGAVRLTVRHDARARSRRVDLPDPATSWISAGRANVLMATLIDGRTFVSDPVGERGQPGWRPVEPVGVDDLPIDGPLYFGAWDPPGGAYALLASDFSEDGGLRVVVVDPALEGASEAIVAGHTALPVPPAWIDDDRVAVVVAGAGGPATVVVDTTSGDASSGPDGVALLATSADASMAAIWRGSGPVEVLATEDWLDGESATIRIDPPRGTSRPGVFALDGTGSRIAIVWLDDAGAPLEITVHEADRNWASATALDVGAVGAASVAWLR